MIERNEEGVRRAQYTVIEVHHSETEETIAKLPEKGPITAPQAGEKLMLSKRELNSDMEITGDENSVKKYIVDERKFEYALLNIEGDEHEDVEAGDQLFSFIRLEVSELKTEDEEA